MADHTEHRPEGFENEGDSCLPKIAGQLRENLVETQKGFTLDTLRLAHQHQQ
jgi:hypothetical protein